MTFQVRKKFDNHKPNKKIKSLIKIYGTVYIIYSINTKGRGRAQTKWWKYMKKQMYVFQVREN